MSWFHLRINSHCQCSFKFNVCHSSESLTAGLPAKCIIALLHSLFQLIYVVVFMTLASDTRLIAEVYVIFDEEI